MPAPSLWKVNSVTNKATVLGVEGCHSGSLVHMEHLVCQAQGRLGKKPAKGISGSPAHHLCQTSLRFSGTQRSKAKVLVMPYVNVPTLGLGRAFPLLGGKGAAGFIWMVGG